MGDNLEFPKNEILIKYRNFSCHSSLKIALQIVCNYFYNDKNFVMAFTLHSKKIFHVCTDGTHNGLVYTCAADFRQATLIAAIAAHVNGVRILCFEHMGSHSHFIISATSFSQAESFATSFKHDYSIYAAHENRGRKIYEYIDSTPREITSVYDLRNCIAYVLLNAVVPRIVKSVEEYPWSSFRAYFNPNPVAGVPVRSLAVRSVRKMFRTRQDLSSSNFLISQEGELDLRSFVDYKTVEEVFGNQTAFFKSLAFTDCAAEEQKYVGRVLRYNDLELRLELENLGIKKFGKSTLDSLTKSEKSSLVFQAYTITHCSPMMIARVLDLDREYVLGILGRDK